MTFRIVLISLALGIFFFIAYLQIRQSISPYDLDKVQELINKLEIEEDQEERLAQELQSIREDGQIIEYLSSQVLVGFTSLVLSVGFTFFAIHTAIDKLFFKKFYETPLLIPGFRRTLIVVAITSTFIYFRLINLDLPNYLGALVAGIVFEMIIISFKRNKKESMKEDLSQEALHTSFDSESELEEETSIQD